MKSQNHTPLQPENEACEMRPAEMPADPHGVSFSRSKDIVKTIENLVEVKLTTKITEKSAVILALNFDVFALHCVRVERTHIVTASCR